MKRKWLLILLMLGVVLIPLMIKKSRGDSAKQVEADVVGRHAVRSSILASGNLAYAEEARLSPEVIGKVTKILVKEGDRVQAGQVVLQIDEAAYRAEIEQQEAVVRQEKLSIEQQKVKLENEEAKFQRNDDLQQRKFIAPAQFEEGRFALRESRIALGVSRERLLQAEAVLKQYRERLGKLSIRAPSSGTVTAIDIKVGETAVVSQIGIAGSSLMTIANVATIMSEVSVDEGDIARIKAGQDVEITTAAYPDTPLKGKVTDIPLSPRRNERMSQSNASQLARNYLVKVSVANPDGLLLRPGMTCRAEIFSASGASVLAVPVQAVLSNNDQMDIGAAVAKSGRSAGAPVKIQNHVFVQRGDVAEKRLIKLGMSDDAWHEVQSGLKGGESVITGPYKLLRHLKDGDRIAVEPSVSVRADLH